MSTKKTKQPTKREKYKELRKKAKANSRDFEEERRLKEKEKYRKEIREEERKKNRNKSGKSTKSKSSKSKSSKSKSTKSKNNKNSKTQTPNKQNNKQNNKNNNKQNNKQNNNENKKNINNNNSTTDESKNNNNNNKKSPQKIPFYLQGYSESKKKNNVGVKERTVHERKKDYKVLTAWRTAESVEKEWINKLKEEQKQNNDFKIDEIDKIEVDWKEINTEVCIEMLLTLDEAWEGRLQIIEYFVNQLCDSNITFEVYYLKMCKFLHPLGHQFTDPRSLIIQGLRDHISRLSSNTPDKFIYFAPYYLERCFPNMPVRIEAVREPAIQLGINLVNNCLSVDKLHNYKLLYKVMSGLDFKHDNTRTCCADLLNRYLITFNILEKENMNENEIKFLEDIDSAVRKAIKDANGECRVNGYKGLYIYSKIAPNKSNQIIEKFSNAVKKKYNQIAEQCSKEQN